MKDETSVANLADDFDAAKTIVEKLKDTPKERQERVLRWVAEGLKLTPAPTPSITPAPAPPPIVNVPVPPSPPPSHDVDIATYVREKQPRSDIQFVTVVAHYYRFMAPAGQRRDSITAAIALDATRLADWDRLADAPSTLNNAKRQGYLDSQARGEYSINTVGENLVARTLPAAGNDGGATTQRRATKGAKKKQQKKAAGRKGVTTKRR